MEKSLQSCCGPFWKLETWSNCVKLCKIQKLLQQKDSVFFFFDLFSVFRFFFSIVLCVFVFDSCRFLFTNHKFDKIQELQKKLFFFVFVSVFSRCFSMFFELFSNRKNIDIFNLFADYMFESQKTIFNLYFRIIFEIKKNM